MTGRLLGSGRRSILAGLLLIAAVVWVGAGTAAALPTDVPSATLQDGTPNNESATNDTTGGATTAQQDGAPPQNDSAAEPGNDAGAPAAESTTAGPPTIVEPDENVTVAVTENQSVRAGASTTLSLEVENDGDDRVRDLVVTLQTAGDALMLGSLDAPQATRSVYVEELQPGRTETIDLDVGAAAVEPGTYPLFASVQYAVDVDGDDDEVGNDTDGDADDDDDDNDADDEDVAVVASGPTVLGVPVTDAVSFDVTPVESEIPVDGSGVYSVRITNDGNETATDVVATLATGPPLTSESPTAYVGTLEPNASATVRFALESSSDAIETTASASITVNWETDAGDRASADPVSVPVDVADADDETDADSVAPFVAVALVLVLAAVWWFRRR